MMTTIMTTKKVMVTMIMTTLTNAKNTMYDTDTDIKVGEGV